MRYKCVTSTRNKFSFLGELASDVFCATLFGTNRGQRPLVSTDTIEEPGGQIFAATPFGSARLHPRFVFGQGKVVLFAAPPLECAPSSALCFWPGKVVLFSEAHFGSVRLHPRFVLRQGKVVLFAVAHFGSADQVNPPIWAATISKSNPWRKTKRDEAAHSQSERRQSPSIIPGDKQSADEAAHSQRFATISKPNPGRKTKRG